MTQLFRANTPISNDQANFLNKLIRENGVRTQSNSSFKQGDWIWAKVTGFFDEDNPNKGCTWEQQYQASASGVFYDVQTRMTSTSAGMAFPISINKALVASDPPNFPFYTILYYGTIVTSGTHVEDTSFPMWWFDWVPAATRSKRGVVSLRQQLMGDGVKGFRALGVSGDFLDGFPPPIVLIEADNAQCIAHRIPIGNIGSDPYSVPCYAVYDPTLPFAPDPPVDADLETLERGPVAASYCAASINDEFPTSDKATELRPNGLVQQQQYDTTYDGEIDDYQTKASVVLGNGLYPPVGGSYAGLIAQAPTGNFGPDPEEDVPSLAAPGVSEIRATRADDDPLVPAGPYAGGIDLDGRSEGSGIICTSLSPISDDGGITTEFWPSIRTEGDRFLILGTTRFMVGVSNVAGVWVGTLVPATATVAGLNFVNGLYTSGSFTGGTVTEINTGTGLTGGPITTTGTISLDSSAIAALGLAVTSLQPGDIGTAVQGYSSVLAGLASSLTASPSELNILDGATISTAELNVLDGLTATTTELNYVDGVTSSIQTQLDSKIASNAVLVDLSTSLTATAAELNVLDGATATTAEINYLSGVTSSIQSQLNAKQGTDNRLTALIAATNGMLAKINDTTSGITGRTITGTASEITVSNGDGVSGNPTLALANNGVTAGVYIAPDSITVDAKGRISSISSGSTANSIRTLAGGRMDLGAEATLSNSSISYRPWLHDMIGLYTGTTWVTTTFTSGSYSHTPASNGVVYDIFLDYNDGSPQLTSNAWSTTTTAPSLSTQDGVLVKTGDVQQRYLGTVYRGADGQIRVPTTTSGDSRYSHIWNYYNRVPGALRRQDSTGNWTYSASSVWRQARADTANQLEIVSGFRTFAVYPLYTANITLGVRANSSVNGSIGIGINSTTAPSFEQAGFGVVNAWQSHTWPVPVAGGLQQINWLEFTTSATQFFGNTTSVGILSGISAQWEW